MKKRQRLKALHKLKVKQKKAVAVGGEVELKLPQKLWSK